MIFTTQCPSCEATFPIDSDKVPDGGVYARCSACEGVFLVEVPLEGALDEAPTGEAVAAPDPMGSEPTDPTPAVDAPVATAEIDQAEAEGPAEAEATAEAEDTTASADSAAPDVDSASIETEIEEWADATAQVTEAPAEAVPSADQTPDPFEPEPHEGSAEAAAGTPATATAPPVFGKRDPHERAQRLARVLVSDMIAYHPDRHRRSLEEGTLKGDFEEEIDKSWNEYVDQVGKELADGTAYFTDALNEILAKGEKVF